MLNNPTMTDYSDIQSDVGVNRTKKIGSVLHRELSLILQSKIADPRIGNITITEVIVSRNLKHAKVFVTGVETSESLQATLSNLNRAIPYIRRQLSEQVVLKFTPSIQFLADELPARGNRVLNLINQVSSSKSEKL